MKQPTLFFGASQFVIPIIEFLQQEYDLLFVVTTEMNPTDAVPAYCKEHTIPYYSVTSLKDPDIRERLQNAHVEFAVLAYFGLIVPQSIIDIFPKGIINIHPSLLPAYRGPTPVQTSILLGDTTTGVSIMLLDSDVDHGPVLAQTTEPITSTDTAISMYERLFPKGVELLREALPKYVSGELVPQEQQHNEATFTKSLTRESGYFDDTKAQPVDLLNRLIRAYYPWPGVWTRCTTLPNSRLQNKIVKFLPGKMLQVEGKKPVSYKDFLNGYPEAADWLQKITK